MGPNNVPIWQLIPNDFVKSMELQIPHGTIATKIKPGKGYNRRLCLRGDRLSLINTSFVSPPHSRAGVFTHCSSFFSPIFLRSCFYTTDISEEFLQSDYYHLQDRIICRLPHPIRARSQSRGREICTDQSLLRFETSDCGIVDLPCLEQNTFRFFSTARYTAREIPQ